MSSSGGGIGATITGGIQDIAAILPLLGTEQCSVQVSSALTRGYLYAAAAPMSIFGSLGVVVAGFKTLVGCISFGDIEGAKILENMGFEPQGENLSLIMVEAGKGKKNTGRYIIETRMDELITELNIDKNRIIRVTHKSSGWNVKMVATTALLCAFSITPYIYLNLGANDLDKSTTWIFPVVRATGGFTTATLIQLLLQRRITTLSNQYLDKQDRALPNADVESGIEHSDTKKRQMDARTWLLLSLLFLGLVASIVGYVGCFSVVQNSMSSTGPVSWFCLEAGLSLMRLAIWAYNPSDNAPPLEIILKLDEFEHKPLPTCNKDDEKILKYKVLPLTRALDFLKIITSFAGLIEPFSHPDLSLYYTLTRKCPSVERLFGGSHKLGERTLYITVFDHKERTTRVYTRDNENDIFYSTKLDAPFVDVGHFLLEVEIDTKIDPKGDPVSGDSNNLDSLRKHHRSILEHIQYRLGAGDVTNIIENSWTMKVEDSISALQKLKEEGNGDDWRRVVENGKEKERNEENLLVYNYFKLPSIERHRRLLDEKRVRWIASRMRMITRETKERLQGVGVEYRVDKQAVENMATKSPEDIEGQLFREQYFMEMLLVYEVMEWEQLFWNEFKAFLNKIGDDRVEVKERLTREWKANCWKRLNLQMHAAKKRLADVRNNGYPLGDRWAFTISQFLEGVENSNSLSYLRSLMEHSDEETRLRMENEIEDTEFRLRRASESGRFDQFWDDSCLFKCRYSRSKWLHLDLRGPGRHYSPRYGRIPLEIYLHALKGNKNITHITFGYRDSDSDIETLICDLPWVTSISRDSSEDSERPPAIHRDSDPLFIRSTNDLIQFSNEVRPKLDPFSTYIFTDAVLNLFTSKLGNNSKVLISFVAPTSDKNLTLRLKHSGKENGPLVVTLGSTTIQLNPSSKSSLTVDDITLHPNPDPDHLSFVPGRNEIVIQFIVERHGHLLHDVELLDEAALQDPRNQIITVARP